MELHSDIESIFISEKEISEIVCRLGEKINQDYEGKNLLIVGILKGAAMFMSDLLRKISIDCAIDFLALSSYNGTESLGKIKLLKELNSNIENYDVLVVEDILDTGNTLHYVKEILQKNNPKSLKICTLLNKPARRVIDIQPDYVGQIIDDKFVVGYGMDYNEKYRNLPYLGILKRSVYAK